MLIIMEINLFHPSPPLLLSQLWHSAVKLTHSVVQRLSVELVCLYTASGNEAILGETMQVLKYTKCLLLCVRACTRHH